MNLNFRAKIVKIQQFSFTVNAQNHDFWRENSNYPGIKISKILVFWSIILVHNFEFFWKKEFSDTIWDNITVWWYKRRGEAIKNHDILLKVGGLKLIGKPIPHANIIFHAHHQLMSMSRLRFCFVQKTSISHYLPPKYLFFSPCKSVVFKKRSKFTDNNQKNQMQRRRTNW